MKYANNWTERTPNNAMHMTSARCRQFPHTSLAYRFVAMSRFVARGEERAEALDCGRSAATQRNGIFSFSMV